MAISGVQVEVDWQSAFAPDSNGKQELTIIRRGDSLGVMALLKERSGFPQRVTLGLDGDEQRAVGPRLGFRRWRIVTHLGDERITLVNVGDASV